MVDERELQRGRPRPELSHRQRRNRLEGGDESVQPLRVEPPGAASNQLESHRVDAGSAGEFIGGDLWKPSKKSTRKIVVDVADGRANEVNVVEQPLRRG